MLLKGDCAFPALHFNPFPNEDILYYFAPANIRHERDKTFYTSRGGVRRSTSKVKIVGRV